MHVKFQLNKIYTLQDILKGKGAKKGDIFIAPRSNTGLSIPYTQNVYSYIS